MHVDADLDIVLAEELRDVVLAAVAARRSQRVHLDITATGELGADASRTIATMLTLLEHRDVVVSVDEATAGAEVSVESVTRSASVSPDAAPGTSAR